LPARCSLLAAPARKTLVNCQNENRELTNNYQDAKEKLAAASSRVASLEDQLAQQKKDNEALCRRTSARA
jgi:chemotaxis protein MotB